MLTANSSACTLLLCVWGSRKKRERRRDGGQSKKGRRDGTKWNYEMWQMRGKVKEGKRIRCREMRWGSVWKRDKQSCSLCHVHTAHDGRASRKSGRARECDRVWGWALVVWLREEDLIHDWLGRELEKLHFSWLSLSSRDAAAAVTTATAAPLFPPRLSFARPILQMQTCHKNHITQELAVQCAHIHWPTDNAGKRGQQGG